MKDGDCGLTDGSSPGDWRLPTKAEWDATMAHVAALGCHSPALTNDAGQVVRMLDPRRLGRCRPSSSAICRVPPVSVRDGLWVASLTAARPATAATEPAPASWCGPCDADLARRFGCGRFWLRVACSNLEAPPWTRRTQRKNQFEFAYVADTTVSVVRVAPVTAPSGIVRSNVARQPSIFLARPRR